MGVYCSQVVTLYGVFVSSLSAPGQRIYSQFVTLCGCGVFASSHSAPGVCICSQFVTLCVVSLFQVCVHQMGVSVLML